MTSPEAENESEEYTVEPGSIVRLRSGGPLMTVEDLYEDDDTGNDMAECTWFDAAGRCRTKRLSGKISLQIELLRGGGFI